MPEKHNVTSQKSILSNPIVFIAQIWPYNPFQLCYNKVYKVFFLNQKFITWSAMAGYGSYTRYLLKLHMKKVEYIESMKWYGSG